MGLTSQRQRLGLGVLTHRLYTAAYKTRQQKLEVRYTLTYLCIIVVGLGSFCFHATLKHGWQLADELVAPLHNDCRVSDQQTEAAGCTVFHRLPMLMVVAQNLFCVSETSTTPGKPKGGPLLPLACAAAFLVPSIIYVYYQK